MRDGSAGAAPSAGSSRAFDHDVADEPQPAAVDGANQALCLAIIADGTPRRLDAAGNRGIRDDASLPDALDDLVARDDAVVVLDQQHEQIEHLWLDRDGRPIPAHFVGLGIDGDGTNQIDHGRCLRRSARLRAFSNSSPSTPD